VAEIDNGLNTWQLMTNHNKMIELQKKLYDGETLPSEAPVELAFFGSSAFRITSPAGISVMCDPWRNFPTRKWDWYFKDFPRVPVDIGVSTHAHFDHDALHRLDAHVLIDRLIGTYTFGDVTIRGIADKHETDSSSAIYDFKKIILDFDGIDITPPNNPRSWDHCLIVIETGGLRIVDWGDNRHNPPDEVWDMLGDIDIALLPVDGSRHVMGFHQVEHIIDRLKPNVVVPHHYYIYDVIQRQSTLQTADAWVEEKPGAVWLDGPTKTYTPEEVRALDRAVHYFGSHVAFDAEAWRNGEN
jgi:L-ascorbate metabolism protein UlaG (beta-lactamase superfamily)